ncbi:GDSL-type esterase/lipase family protein [Halocola ammonii]
MTRIALFISLLIGWLGVENLDKNETHHREQQTRVFPAPEIDMSHSFINYDLNKIDFPGRKNALYSFYGKLDSLVFDGYGKVNVLHMGGSHVQAGVLSNTMRENFFSLAPSLRGERGVFFPFRLAHTNSPWNIDLDYTGNWDGYRNSVPKHESRWGMTGVTATTYDSTATVKLWTFDSDSVPYSFNRLKVFHTTDSTSYNLCLPEKYEVIRSKLDTAAGFTEFVFAGTYDTLEFFLEKNFPFQNHFDFQGVKYETGEPGLTYSSIGVNGASVPSYLRCQKFVEQLHTSPPDLVIFGIGINDAYMPSSAFSQEEFEENYTTLMNQIRETNPRVNFLFLTNNDSYYKRRYPNRNALAVKESMYKLAEEEGAAVWDLFEIMGGLNSIYTWDKAGLAKGDKIHLTREGYRLQADMLFHAIREDFGNYLNLKNQ